MTKISSENRIGFLGSVIFHSALFLFCLLYTLSVQSKKPEFVELSFTEVSAEIEPATDTFEEPAPEPTTENITNIKPGGSATAVKSKPSISNKVSNPSGKPPRIALPRYGLSPDNENTRLPETKMNISDSKYYDNRENQGKLEGGNPNLVRGEKENRTGKISGEQSTGISSTKTTGKDLNEPGSSRNIGKDVSNFSIQWKDGGLRSRTSGMLPKFPENVNKEVQIKMKITVAPDGSVLQIIPMQKGDYKFESATIQALRTWKFEPLKPTSPQVEQSAIITFLFKFE